MSKLAKVLKNQSVENKLNIDEKYLAEHDKKYKEILKKMQEDPSYNCNEDVRKADEKLLEIIK